MNFIVVLKGMKGIANDGLFTIDEQRELADGIPNADLVTISSGMYSFSGVVDFDIADGIMV